MNMMELADSGLVSNYAIGFGVFVIVVAVMAVVSFFSSKETSFEDVLEKQRSLKQLQDKERSRLNKQKREQYKRKFDSKKKKSNVANEKMPSEMKDVSPGHEVQVKHTEMQPVKENVKKPKTKPVQTSKVKKEISKPKEAPAAVETQQTLPPSAKQIVQDETKSKQRKPAGPKKEKEAVKIQQEKASDPAYEIKSKKRKAKTLEANPIIEAVRSTDMDNNTVQILLDYLSKKLGGGDWMAVGTGITKQQYGELQKQLGDKETEIMKHIDQSIKYKHQLTQLNQVIESSKKNENQYKTEMVFHKNENENLHGQMKRLQADNAKQIQVLQNQLHMTTGNVDKFQRLKEENEILKTTIQANAKEISEKHSLAQELQLMRSQLLESNKAKRDLECQIKEYTDSLQQRQAEVEQSYSQRIDEITKKVHEAQGKYGVLESDFQKAQSDLQFSQVVMLSEATDQRSTLEKEYGSLAETKQALEQRLTEMDENDAQRAEEMAKLHTQNKSFKIQVDSLSVKNNELTEEVNALKQENNKTTEQLQRNASKEELVATLKSENEACKAETNQVKEDIHKLKKKNNELRERNWKAMDALSSAEQLTKNKIEDFKEEIVATTKTIQKEVKKEFKKKFPHISCKEKEFHLWLQQFLSLISVSTATTDKENSDKITLLEQQNTMLEEKVQKVTHLQHQMNALQDSLDAALKRNKQNEEQSEQLKTLIKKKELEVENYKDILAQTEMVLASLQSSVEQKERETESREQVGKCENMTAITQVEEQKEELEKKLQEKINLVEALTTECSRLKEQLNEMQQVASGSESSSSSPVPVGFVDAKVDSAVKLTEDDQGFVIIDHQLKQSSNHVTQENGQDDEIAKLKERLEKEKTLTKSLGAAAGKLQTVLKQTQDQLNKEREKNKELELLQENYKDNSAESPSN